jgi:hypothetical protein
MQFVSIIKYSCFVLCLLASGTAQVAAQSVLIRAEAKPSVVMVGESASYSIRFLNTDSIPNLNTPRVANLEFSNTPGTSSYQQIINGKVSVETEMNWSFRPMKTGTYTIPGRTVQVRGENIKIPDVEIKVVPMDEEARSRALLQLEVPRPPYYVGQALPARLALLIRKDLNLSNVAFPESEGDAFQHSEFDNNPARGTITHEGRTYNALVWDILITPIKAGPAELSFRQNIALQFVSSDSRFPSIFTMSRTRTESTTVFSKSLETDVLSLPETDASDSFSGGIGNFKVTSTLSTTDLTVGEPITLTINLKGEGNFDRISPPDLPDWENWRIYPPKVTFTPEDTRSFKGEKSFEFIIIPQAESIDSIPEIAYASFNPKLGSYESTLLESVAVTIKPSDKSVDTSPFIPSMGKDAQDSQQIPENILPLKPEPGDLHPSGSVLWKESRFWIINATVAVVLGLLAFWQFRRRRIRSDVTLSRRHAGSRQVRKALQKAQAAAKSGDVEAFLKPMRFVLQESICHLSKKNLEAKTLVTSDCLDILATHNVADPTPSKIAKILNAADAHQFAGSHLTPEDISSMYNDLTSIVSELNRYIR